MSDQTDNILAKLERIIELAQLTKDESIPRLSREGLQLIGALAGYLVTSVRLNPWPVPKRGVADEKGSSKQGADSQ